MKNRAAILVLLAFSLVFLFPWPSYAMNSVQVETKANKAINDIYNPEQQVQLQVLELKNHWARDHVLRLNDKYAINQLLGSYQLDDQVTREQLEKMVNSTIAQNYRFKLETTARQEFISKLVDLLAWKTGINLEETFFITVVTFKDSADISAQYRHNIMYAFHTGLVKGNGAGMFKPLDPVTYAEALALADRVDQMFSTQLLNIEAKARQESSVAKFDFALVNNSNQDQHLTFPSGQMYEIVVYSEKGEEVYRYSSGKAFIAAIVKKTIPAGERLSFTEEWDLKDNTGQKLPPGNYKAEITFLIKESPCSVNLGVRLSD